MTPLRGVAAFSVLDFEERGDADDQQHLYCWQRLHACVSGPARRRHSSGCCRQPGSTEHRDDDSLDVYPHTVHRGAARGAAFLIPRSSHHRDGPISGAPGGSSPPRSTTRPSRRDLRPAHIHGPSQTADSDGAPSTARIAAARSTAGEGSSPPHHRECDPQPSIGGNRQSIRIATGNRELNRRKEGNGVRTYRSHQ